MANWMDGGCVPTVCWFSVLHSELGPQWDLSFKACGTCPIQDVTWRLWSPLGCRVRAAGFTEELSWAGGEGELRWAGRQDACPICFARALRCPRSSCQAGSLWGRRVCQVGNRFLQLKQKKKGLWGEGCRGGCEWGLQCCLTPLRVDSGMSVRVSASPLHRWAH